MVDAKHLYLITLCLFVLFPRRAAAGGGGETLGAKFGEPTAGGLVHGNCLVSALLAGPKEIAAHRVLSSPKSPRPSSAASRSSPSCSSCLPRSPHSPNDAHLIHRGSPRRRRSHLPQSQPLLPPSLL